MESLNSLSDIKSCEVPLSDVMFDLETLAVTPDATILSVAAVNVDPAGARIGKGFYTTVSHADQGRRICPATVTWWKNQHDLLRAETFKGECTLEETLKMLGMFIRPNQRVWGNGSSFDIAILEHAFVGAKLKTPWKFWNVRDLRTRIQDAKELAGFNHKKIPFVGRKHHALDDAVHQAKILIASHHALFKP